MSEVPYLDGRPRELFDAWHVAAVERFERNLTFKEIRKGVQALSSLYVERRREVAPAKALDGQGKRAAFVVYYGALHYIVVHHVVRRAGLDRRSLRRLLDLGCGAGVAGAAWANLLPNEASVTGVDRSGFALDEAASTYASFGLRHATFRGSLLEQKLPGQDEGLVLAWALGEIHERSRAYMVQRVHDAVVEGAALLVVEPVAHAAAPWWDDWARTLAPHEVTAEVVRLTLRLPPWLAHMDKASGLRHGTITVRVMHT